MCIAIYTPSGVTVSKEILENSYENNSDGCGFAYITAGGALVIEKTMRFPEFMDMYRAARRANPASPFLIHFRIATHGTVNEFNCHPFQIDEEHVFIHNGTISKAPSCPEKKRSDTQMFNETVLKNLPEGWMGNDGLKPLIEEYIAHSKIVVMNRQGEVQIYNESKGHWKDGAWFSNHSYHPRRYTTQTNYYAATTPVKEEEKHVYKQLSDGTWTYNGKHRRRVNNQIEQWDDILLKWRPYDIVKKEYADDLSPGKSNVIQLPGTSHHVFECHWCDDKCVKEENILVVSVHGALSLMCKQCKKELANVSEIELRPNASKHAIALAMA